MDRFVPLPPLPSRIGRLSELAYDLAWSWTPEAREVFRDLDYPLWRFTDHNPVLLLHLVEADRLAHASTDPEFLALYDRAIAALARARPQVTWWSQRVSSRATPDGESLIVALITPRIAIHKSLPVEMDAAAVLAAECCKEASDLGIPLTAVALMYPNGYAHQRLSSEGWQEEAYEYIDWSDAPIRPALCPDGSRCEFHLTIGAKDVYVVVWQVRVGRVTLFLLDTDIDANAPWDRELASGTFPADPDARARQGVLIGAGAVTALDHLGIRPGAWHLSEGLAAFVSLERVNRAVARGETLEAAVDHVRRTTMFVTREAQPARADALTFATLDRQMATAWQALVPLREAVLQFGHYETDRGGAFHPSAFGAATSGLAVRYGTAFSSLPEEDEAVRQAVAGGSVPEGMHLPSWISADLAAVFEEAIGPDWRERQDDAAAWDRLHQVSDAVVWDVRQRLRSYLIEFMRMRARRCWSRERANGTRLVALGTLLDPSALTIGYAQCFGDGAGPEFLFDDPSRLAAILTATRRPVQIIFAGRAAPGDEIAKHHLQRLFRHALDPAFGGRVAFLEDYDLHVARLLVQGCDVWLGTARPEAAAPIGGLQAAINGVPHLGTAAAWWPDGWTGGNGWIIETGHGDSGRDVPDSRAVYQLIEDHLVPAFYARDRGGAPQRWLSFVRESIVNAVPRFCARRMVKAFAEAHYLQHAAADADALPTRSQPSG